MIKIKLYEDDSDIPHKFELCEESIEIYTSLFNMLRTRYQTNWNGYSDVQVFIDDYEPIGGGWADDKDIELVKEFCSLFGVKYKIYGDRE